MKIRLFLLITLLFTPVLFSNDEVIYETFFRSDNFGGTIKTGKYKLTENGLHLTSNSRMGFSIPQARKIVDGTINFAFLSPDLDKNIIPTMISSKECFCAIKLRIGLCEVEFSEKWIRVQQFRPGIKDIDKILSQVDMEINPQSTEYKIRIIIQNNELTLSVNNMEMLKTPGIKHDFNDIAISTFQYSFDILTLSLSSPHKNGYSIDKAKKHVDAVAVFHPSRFNKGTGLKEHHFIVWESGNAVKNALFTTFVSDSMLHQAIVEAGGKPGNNLTQEAWTKRKSKKSKEPDKRAQGSKIDLEIIYGNRKFLPDQVLTEVNNNHYDFHFAGNLALIPHWRSGCIVCLQSCPGGKIGNSTYTIRDLVKGIPKFETAKGLPFGEGDKVVIRFLVK